MCVSDHRKSRKTKKPRFCGWSLCIIELYLTSITTLSSKQTHVLRVFVFVVVKNRSNHSVFIGEERGREELTGRKLRPKTCLQLVSFKTRSPIHFWVFFLQFVYFVFSYIGRFRFLKWSSIWWARILILVLRVVTPTDRCRFVHWLMGTTGTDCSLMLYVCNCYLFAWI